MIFKGFLVAKNCLRHGSAPLKKEIYHVPLPLPFKFTKL